MEPSAPGREPAPSSSEREQDRGGKAAAADSGARRSLFEPYAARKPGPAETRREPAAEPGGTATPAETAPPSTAGDKLSRTAGAWPTPHTVGDTPAAPAEDGALPAAKTDVRSGRDDADAAKEAQRAASGARTGPAEAGDRADAEGARTREHAGAAEDVRDAGDTHEAGDGDDAGVPAADDRAVAAEDARHAERADATSGIAEAGDLDAEAASSKGTDASAVPEPTAALEPGAGAETGRAEERGQSGVARAGAAGPDRERPPADDHAKGPEEKPGTPAAAEKDGSPATALDDNVTIVPGISRYHQRGCILIRFLSDGDLEIMTRREAEAAGSMACKACQPDMPVSDE